MYIRVIDLETTHETPADGGGVVELGKCDVIATEFDLLGAPIRWEVEGPPWASFTDPGCPIPAITSAIHHILDEDVRGMLPWRDVLCSAVRPAGERPVALAAHSASFEQLWCKGMTEVPWLCTYKGSLRMWPDLPKHSNMALRYLRSPPGLDRQTALPAHRAGPDAYVTAFHVRDLLNEGALRDEQVDIAVLARWASEPALQSICHIGDWRGKKWAEVDDGFIQWILRKGTFDEDVIFTCQTQLALRAEEWQRQQREGTA